MNPDSPLLGESELREEDLEGPVVDRRTTMRIIGALGAMGMASIAGCTGSQEGEGQEEPEEQEGDEETETATEAETETSEKYGGRLKAAFSQDETGRLEPAFQPGTTAIRIITNISNGLVTINPDLTLRGDLAEDWTVEDDGTRYRFTLREGALFHNGDEVTADDFMYTYERNTTKEVTPQADAQLENVEGVTAVDDYTVDVEFSEPLAAALAFLTRGGYPALNVVNQRAIEEMGESAYQQEPVLTGPFMVTNHELDDSVTLDRFDDYFETDEDGNQLPYLDGIDITMVPEPSSIANALQTGEMNFSEVAPEQVIDQLKQADNVNVVESPDLMFRAIFINENRGEPFTNDEYRLAIAKAMDAEGVIENAFFGTGVPSHGPYYPGMEWLYRSTEEYDDQQAYDPEEAERMLDDLGAKDEPIEYISWPGKERLGRVLRQQLQEIGVEVEVNALPSSTFLERLRNGEFDIAPGASYGDVDPDTYIRKLWHSEGALHHWSGYENERVDELIDQQRTELDRETRIEQLHEIEDILNREVGAVFLTHRFDSVAHGPAVKGFELYGSMRYLHRTWLDE